MPSLALYTFEQRFAISPPPTPPLVSERLRLAVEIDGVSTAFSPYVFLDPGRPFSVVSHTLAGHLGCSPVPVSQDPVPVELSTPFGYQPAGTMPAARLTDWRGNPCDLVTTAVQFVDRVSGARTARLRLFAHCPRGIVPNFADSFIILGYSFLRDNLADVSIIHSGRAFTGRLDVP